MAIRRKGKQSFCNCCSKRFKFNGCCDAVDDDDDTVVDNVDVNDDVDAYGVRAANDVCDRSSWHLFVIFSTNAIAAAELQNPFEPIVSFVK